MNPAYFEHLHPHGKDLEKTAVSVTPGNIAAGKRGDAILCPLAIAIKQLLKRGDCVVTSKHVMFYSCAFDRTDIDIVLGKGRIATIFLPDPIESLIKDYEDGEDFVPFTIEILIPLELLTDG